MKRIAIFTDGLNRIVDTKTSNALVDTLTDSGEKVILCQFNSFSSWGKDEAENNGEFSIYELPDLSVFDGIVLDINTIVDMAQAEKLIRLAKEAKAPVISVGSDVDGFYFIGIDNKRAIFEMMTHLYEEHRCRNFVFAGGRIANDENALRCRAFKDFLSIYDLDVAENPTLFGDFNFLAGCNHFDTIVSKYSRLPDAVVCANDDIAAGVIHEAAKRGLKVPNDFLVTGFDNSDTAKYYVPQISTVGTDKVSLGKMCADIFKNIWAGSDANMRNYLPMNHYFTESCGCSLRDDVDIRKHAMEGMFATQEGNYKCEKMLGFEGRILKCKEIKDIFSEAYEFYSVMNCDRFRFFIDDRIFSADSEISYSGKTYDWSHIRKVKTDGNLEETGYENFEELISTFENTAIKGHCLFTPIHFGEIVVGFSVFNNAEFIKDDTYFYDVHRTFVKALENLYIKKLLEIANKNLNDLYIKDPMTGAFNRIAFVEKIVPSLNVFHKQGVSCGIAFVDADNFKQINDEFGHVYGDRVLKIIASKLKKYCPEDGFVCRYGGDEFVIFYPYNEGTLAIEDYKDAVFKALKKENISISMGIVTTNPSSSKGFDEYIHETDNRMYNEKQRKKIEARS